MSQISPPLIYIYIDHTVFEIFLSWVLPTSILFLSNFCFVGPNSDKSVLSSKSGTQSLIFQELSRGIFWWFICVLKFSAYLYLVKIIFHIPICGKSQFSAYCYTKNYFSDCLCPKISCVSFHGKKLSSAYGYAANHSFQF